MKNKFVIFGLLLITLLLFSCKQSAEPDNNTYYTVTIDFGEYGVHPSTGETTYSVKVNTKSPYLDEIVPAIKELYQTKLEFYSYYFHDSKDNMDYYFSLATPISADMKLYALYRAKPVQNLSVSKENDTEIKLTWDAVPDSKYKVEIVPSVGEKETVENISETEFSQTIADGATSYNFSITTISELNSVFESAKVSKAINIAKKESEWLVLLYMDGDNNLNDPIYLDLNEAESGLAKLEESDSVTVVALWDGWDFETGATENSPAYSDFDQVPATYGKINTSSTRLLELGADKNALYAENGGWYYIGVQLSSDTKDLTDTAEWIEDGEVNMASRTTLEEFLKWVNKNYSADKTILQFSNHGGGPRTATGSKKNYGRRSMCWDDTSGGKDSFLKTSDVSYVLKKVGYGTDNKLKMILEDVCLGGSLEEVYELRNYAEYYIGSPNNVPGSGFDYDVFISSLTKNADIKTVGSKLIKAFKEDYTLTQKSWNEFFSDNKITEAQVNSSNYLPFNVSIYNPNCPTLSFIDLSKVDAIKNAVDDLATLILSDNEDDLRIKYDSADNKFYDTEYDEGIPATAFFIPRKDAVKYHAAYYGDPIYYDGTFGCLKDLGFMLRTLHNVYFGNWDDLTDKIDDISYALKEAIIGCWRDGYTKPTYYKIPGETQSSFVENMWGCGLTINCSVWVPHTAKDGKTYLYQEFADWYEDELAFGKDSTWTTLIKDWFGTEY